MSKSTENVAEEFAAELAAVHEGVTSLAARLTKLVQSQAPSVGQRFSDAVGDATGKIGDKIADKAADAQESVYSAGREIEACIEKKPLTSVLIAFGVGISLGVLSRLRG